MGLRAFIIDQSTSLHSTVIMKYQDYELKRPAIAPAPWIKAADFTGRLVGQALGKALKEAYWAQLELESPDESYLPQFKIEMVDKLCPPR